MINGTIFHLEMINLRMHTFGSNYRTNNINNDSSYLDTKCDTNDDTTHNIGHHHTLILTITSTYKQYNKKPIIVAITRPLRTSIGPNLNTA